MSLNVTGASSSLLIAYYWKCISEPVERCVINSRETIPALQRVVWILRSSSSSAVPGGGDESSSKQLADWPQAASNIAIDRLVCSCLALESIPAVNHGMFLCSVPGWNVGYQYCPSMRHDRLRKRNGGVAERFAWKLWYWLASWVNCSAGHCQMVNLFVLEGFWKINHRYAAILSLRLDVGSIRVSPLDSRLPPPANCRRTIQLTHCPRSGRLASPPAPNKSLFTKPARAELPSQDRGTAKLGILICTTAWTSAWLPRFSMLPKEDKKSEARMVTYMEWQSVVFQT